MTAKTDAPRVAQPDPAFLPLGDDFPEPHMGPGPVQMIEPADSLSEAERLANMLELCHTDNTLETHAAAELRRLAAVEAAYDGKAHELVVLEDAYDLLTDARDRLIEERDDLRAARDRLAAEVEALRADAERLDFIASHARCDPKLDGQHVWWPTSFNHRLTGPTLRAAIDAAKAKGAA